MAVTSICASSTTAVRANQRSLVYAAQLGNARNLLLPNGSLGFACERRSYWRTWSHGGPLVYGGPEKRDAGDYD